MNSLTCAAKLLTHSHSRRRIIEDFLQETPTSQRLLPVSLRFDVAPRCLRDRLAVLVVRVINGMSMFVGSAQTCLSAAQVCVLDNLFVLCHVMSCHEHCLHSSSELSNLLKSKRTVHHRRICAENKVLIRSAIRWFSDDRAFQVLTASHAVSFTDVNRPQRLKTTRVEESSKVA